MSLDGMWWVKYRPQTLEDLCISSENRETLEKYSAEKNIPHLLFTSGSGQGKTTLAQIIVKDILKCDYLYINASEENGIDTVRDKIIGFSQTKSFDGEIKVVILDEVDGFTSNAQDSLRNTMEEYATTTRFILTGNYRHKVKIALQSRCQSLNIRPPLKDSVKRCWDILKWENVKVSADQKELLKQHVKRHHPDLRKCIGEMQKYCKGGVLDFNREIDTDSICSLIYKNLTNKKSLDTRKYLIQNEDIFSGEWENLLVIDRKP